MTPEQRHEAVRAVFELVYDALGTPASEGEVEGFALTLHLMDLDQDALASVFAAGAVMHAAAVAERDRRLGSA